VNSRDLEAGPTRPELETEKSTRSIKDPNLVSSPSFRRLLWERHLTEFIDR
jgi:hypothetical protein